MYDKGKNSLILLGLSYFKSWIPLGVLNRVINGGSILEGTPSTEETS